MAAVSTVPPAKFAIKHYTGKLSRIHAVSVCINQQAMLDVLVVGSVSIAKAISKVLRLRHLYSPHSSIISKR